MRLTGDWKNITGTWTLFSVVLCCCFHYFYCRHAFKAIRYLIMYHCVRYSSQAMATLRQENSDSFIHLQFIGLRYRSYSHDPFWIITGYYLTQYAQPITLKVMRSVIDILAGIPSVIHACGCSHCCTPGFRIHCSALGNTPPDIPSGRCIVLAIATLPFVLHMLLEVFRSIPIELKEQHFIGRTYWRP